MPRTRAPREARLLNLGRLRKYTTSAISWKRELRLEYLGIKSVTQIPVVDQFPSTPKRSSVDTSVNAGRLLVTYAHVPIWITSGLPTIRTQSGVIGICDPIGQSSLPVET